ncbi:MAG: hypothetical protein J6038_02940 [Bacilli bacterium]|nr:hypothetical protein [Bacilli bacterium]
METEKEQAEAFAGLKRKMRLAYQEIGLSPTSRLACKEDDLYIAKSHKQGASYRFLQKLRKFSDALPVNERQVLLNSVLESAYHYEFWHMSFFNPREYRAVLRSLAGKIKEAFPS